MKKLKKNIIIFLTLICLLTFISLSMKNRFISLYNFDSEQREIGIAILEEDNEKISALIKNNFSPDLINKKGESLLMFAIKNNKQEAIKSIVKNGANINMVVDQMYSAIETAIKSKNNKLLELIIQLGGDVNLLHSQSSRPLNYAFYYKNLEAVEILIKNKADINLPDTLGNSVFVNLIFIKDFKSALKLLTFVSGDINNPINSLPRVKHKIVAYLDMCNRERHFKDKDYLNLVNELKKLGFQFKNI